MNFLAHLVLAPQTPASLIGSIAPDMIRGPLPADLDDAVMQAAREHRSIDLFTDTHRGLMRTRDRLREIVHPRLTGVLADVLYDHVLARDWARWRGDLFAPYVSNVEANLIAALHYVPEQMRLVVRRMVDEQWLISYATAHGICARLETMSRRLTSRIGRPMSLAISKRDLRSIYKPLAGDFGLLWPELLEHVKQQRVERRGCFADPY
ncbi:MAG: ACP phosphodiesterase [Planctomycetota bacterium]